MTYPIVIKETGNNNTDIYSVRFDAYSMATYADGHVWNTGWSKAPFNMPEGEVVELPESVIEECEEVFTKPRKRFGH